MYNGHLWLERLEINIFQLFDFFEKFRVQWLFVFHRITFSSMTLFFFLQKF